MGSVQRRNYPEAFKREAVERVGSSGLTVGKVASELGIHEAILRRWVRQLSPAGAAPTTLQPRIHAITPLPADLAAENHRLRRENERLKMEREILKNSLRASRTARLDRNTVSSRLMARRERGRPFFGGI